MYRDCTIGVVVPAYNEESLIETVIETIPAYVDRIYVVDDGSTDDTWSVIRESARRVNERARREGSISVDGARAVEASGPRDQGVKLQVSESSHFEPRVCPIQHERNRGVGGAIKTGYRRALDDGLDITAVMGGDGQMDPNLLYKFLDPIVEDRADYTKGNRLLYREYRAEMPRFRFIGNSILTFLTKIASGYWKTMDPQNGYTAISREALRAVEIDEMYEYYGYCNDLLVKLNTRGQRVADVAMPAKYDEAESSITYPTYIWKVSGMLFRNYLWRLHVKHLILDFHPLALFYYAAVGTVGLGLTAWLWSLLTAGRVVFLHSISSLLVVLFGILLFLHAMVFDMRESRDKEIQIRD